jgi:hypothetical protein
LRPRDRATAKRLDARLRSFDQRKHHLPGIRNPDARATFLEQLLESIHRVKYVSVIRDRPLSERRMDPDDELFHPLKAAILHQRRGEIEEAYWLVFLFVHFGKHAKGGWRYAREVYGRLGANGRWDWASVTANPAAFRVWLHAHQNDLKRAGAPGGFGNHRKYQSLSAYSSIGTGAAVESYVNWINPPRTHAEVFAQAVDQSNHNPRQAFDELYRSMDAVASFGRTARFDYLTMVGKLGLAPIEPGLTYMRDATGPRDGAKLLFGSKRRLNAAQLEELVGELDSGLKVGMQVLEDALCNWHKSPKRLVRFRG